ncbi:signal peptidase I [Planotetraspora kaengkrachanensis]|uniref:Signal peptidase I n=1 Tax=Planotetraspora kaengkrachanensis TaxID=575193 RepID=A0A8J3PQF7_9ACTN|nr:signal peptidase I [Planotetraspora kaengkrachanensis]GIG77374.1 signal peptidase I [Planotetraspora kaengkrachanensis]
MNLRRLSVLLLTALTVVSASGCGVAYRLTGREEFDVPGISMEPTIKTGDRVVASLSDGDYTPHEGDVVVYKAPPSWAVATPGKTYIARVIGTPGVDVRCCDDAGHIALDGRPLDEPYIASAKASAVEFDLTVPPGHVWIMGDNRDFAMDSRAHSTDADKGTIPLSYVVGVVDVPDQAG